jgi:hypothetical protein
VLILPWNLRTEIAAQLRHVREWGGRFVTAVPELVIDRERWARHRSRRTQHEPPGWLSSSSFSAWVGGVAARLSGAAVSGKAGGIAATVGATLSTTTGAAGEGRFGRSP